MDTRIKFPFGSLPPKVQDIARISYNWSSIVSDPCCKFHRIKNDTLEITTPIELSTIIQHKSPEIIHAVNLYAGFNIISKVKILPS